MSNDTQAPNVNIGEQNVPENLAEQSGLPNMSSTKVFKVETDMLVLGDVYADNFIGRGAAGGTYATQVGFNPEDPLDTASVVLDAGTDGTDSLLTVKTIITDGTVDFTGATLIGIPDLVGISLTDLSVSVDPAGVANLEYDNTTGVFTYTPPDLSSYLTASSTDTLTNKSGSNSQWTNDEGYTTNVGTVTPDSTDTFTNKSGSNSQWTNDEGYTTNVGTTTADNVQTFTNKSGSNSQWTNDEGYIDLTDLSVSVATEGTANLSYDNISGVFTYTPPSLDGYLPLSGGTLTAPLYFEDGGITVGGIGTNGGRLSIGSGDVNLNFNASANSIYPISDTAGTLSDAIVDIGASNARFKDLYLAGTATMDGLTVDTAAPFMSFKESGATKLFIGESSAVGGGAGYYDFYAVTGLGQRFFTNSVERMRIDSSGNLTMASGGSIVAGGANDLILNAGESGTPDIYLQSGGSTKVKIEGSNGNVGIGTSLPDAKFHSYQPAANYAAHFESANANSYGVWVEESASANNGYPLLSVTDNGGSTQYFRVDSGTGNVGIGTSSPSSFNYLSTSPHLVVGGGSSDAGVTYYSSTNGYGRLAFADGTNTTEQYRGLIQYYHGDNSMQFYTGSDERMRITSNGSLYIGDGFTTWQSNSFGVETSSAGAYTVTSHINGAPSGQPYSYFFYNNGVIGSITQNGTTGVAYNTSSDYRLKENVVPMTGSIDRVKALKPSRFNFIADADTTVDGFLAHEAQAVVPECVTGTKDAMKDEEYEVTAATEEVRDEDGNITTEAVEAVMGTRSVPDYQGIDQSKLVPLLTAALQEAITKIESLTTRIEALEE